MAIAQNNPITASEVMTALNAKADSNHTHDERYYTESEVESILNEVMPPPAAPTIQIYQQGISVTNNDTRSVTFYYKAFDNTVSNTNYSAYKTLAPNSIWHRGLSGRKDIKFFIIGYIRDMASPVKSGVWHAGGGGSI